jgi:O-antigen/teichoic acid export membrane protein
LALAGFIWSGSLVHNIAQVFDSLLIGSVLEDGLAFVAIYSLAQNISSLIQAPQRAITSSAIPALADAWKQKDLARIDRIYHRSSINMLLFAVGMFVLIWINFIDGIATFNIQGPYREAQIVFLYIGLMKVIDLGTGINSQIIGTSNYWRFEFLTGVILILLTLPLNYIFTKSIGITGTAIANLISFTIYNAIRYFFLLRKFKMQPFTIKSLYALLLAVAGYFVCHWLFSNQQGFLWIILRSTVFIGIFLGGVLALKISPDILPVWEVILKKVRLKK